MRIIVYFLMVLSLTSCSSIHFNQLLEELEDQFVYEQMSYNALHKLKSSFDEDTVFTQASVFLTHNKDSVYPFEFLIIDSTGNFVSFVNDTVHSYHQSFGRQYYDLKKINGLEMISSGYKFNTLLPEVVTRTESLKELKWSRKKKGKLKMYLGESDDVSTVLWFNKNGLLSKAAYTFYSTGYYYYDEHQISNYRFDFQQDTLQLRKDELERYINLDKEETTDNNMTLSFPTFKNLYGEEVNISADQIVILDFFFNGCPPCVASIPKLNELYDIVGNEIPMYGINAIDKSAKQIKDFQTKYGVQYPLLMADKNFNSSLRINSYPELLVIKNGEVIYRHIGTLHTIEDLVGFLEEKGFSK